MVNTTNNKNHFISSISKMLKPLLRLLSKRSRPTLVQQTDCTSDFNAENEANEALEARFHNTTVLSPCYLMMAPDRDLLQSSVSSLIGAQIPEQQSPSPRGGVQLEEQWW